MNAPASANPPRMIEPKEGILSISPYIPGKTSRAADSKPLKLSSNENPYGPSPRAVEAYMQASSTLNRYPDGGCAELREAIGSVHRINPQRIVCGAGSDELIGLLIHAYAGPGDEILYSAHGFLMYAIYARSFGATPVTAPEKNLCADVDALLKAVTEKTKIIFVANPNNPTGSYLPKAELQRLRDGLPDNVILAVDAAYAEYPETPDYSDGRELVEATHNTVMFRTFSKIYGLSALRLGWMYGPDHIIDVMNRVRSPFNVTAPAQAAGIAAVQDQAWIGEQRWRNNESLNELSDVFREMGYTVYPSATNFLLIDCASPDKAEALVGFLAAQDIYVRDVAAYGLPSCVRISIGTVEENGKLVAAMKGMQDER